MSFRGDNSLWGDGFVDDDWSAMAAVRRWDSCEPDQYVRFYPGLAARRGGLPAPLRAHLTEVIAERRRGLLGLSWEPDGAPEGRKATGMAAAAVALWRRVAGCTAPKPTDIASDKAALSFLEDILAAVRSEAPGEADGRRAATFAFLTGIHPAYLWPAAALAQDRHATAGWLGVVARGRSALMPADVADYLVDTISCRDGRPIAVRDREMADLVRAARADLGDLWRVAVGRRAGRGLVLRQRRRPPLAPAPTHAAMVRIDLDAWKVNRL